MDSETPAEPQTFPLSVALEGQSWILTALVESTVAIWMILLKSERTGLIQSRVSFGGQWTEEIVNYFFFMVMGAVTAGLAVGVLSLNLRPATKGEWRLRSFRSIIALIALDAMALDHVAYLFIYMGKAMIREKESDDGMLIASSFLTFVGILCTIAFNVQFVRLFGFCACCRGKKHGDKIVQRAQDYLAQKEEIPVAILPEASICTVPSGIRQESMSSNAVSVSEASIHTVPSGIRQESMSSNAVSIPDEDLIDYNRQDSGSSSQRNNSMYFSSMENLQTLRSLTEPSDSSPVRKAVPAVKRWDTKQLIEIGCLHLSEQKFLPKSKISTDASTLSDEKKINAQLSIPRRPKRRLPTAPDITKSVRNILQGEHQVFLSRFPFSRSSINEFWRSVREEPGQFTYAAWIKTAFFTSVVVLIYTGIQSVSIIASLVDSYTHNREKLVQHIEGFNAFLIDAGWIDGVSTLTKYSTSQTEFMISEFCCWCRMTVVRLYLLVDDVIVDLKWTSSIGYPLGTLFGLYGLVAVLVQHKRMSLAVSNSLKVFSEQFQGQNPENNPWLQFQKKYPILDACFFLAILSSTAVLQAQILGSILSVIFGLLLNLPKLHLLLELFAFYALAYIVVFLLDVVVMRFLRSSLMTEDGFRIRHPRWFNFFMVVLSMVHLVIGLLYALWRVLYLMVTTVFVLNRLDVCLFTTGKSLDNGHNAFMSMMVLTVLIQQDSPQYFQKTDSEIKSTTF